MLKSQFSKQFRLLLCCAAGLSVAFASACKSNYPASGKAATGDPKGQPRVVKTVQVAETPIGETVTVNGTLAAYDQTTVGMKVAGRLQSISVDLGTIVRKGQA